MSGTFIEWLGFAGVMALGQFSPGPDMVLLTRTSLAHGAGAGMRMAAGIASGLAVHAGLAIGGVGLMLAGAPWWRTGLGVAAAAYLGWLGWRLLRSPGIVADGELPADDPGGPFRRGLACNLLNPKAALFLAAVTAPFLAGRADPVWAGVLWATIVFEGLLLWMLWARLLQWRPLRAGYRRRAKWIDRGFGAVLWVLAALLLAGMRVSGGG